MKNLWIIGIIFAICMIGNVFALVFTSTSGNVTNSTGDRLQGVNITICEKFSTQPAFVCANTVTDSMGYYNIAFTNVLTRNDSYINASYNSIFKQIIFPHIQGHNDLINFQMCAESWIQHNSTCNGKNYTISYNDTNNCGTFVNLPVDNGTTITCSIPEESSSHTSYAVDANGNIVGVVQGNTLTPVPTTNKGTSLSVAGQGTGFDIITWLTQEWNALVKALGG